uniref:ATP synthase complex subunit h n=1 Tax=Puccinia cf. psidii AE-2014 TaxID=1505670 RepID=A0A060IMW2_9BASI|nr:ATP synthase complex subunit h [Puccinia cf. psidii AE-2014]
MLKSSVVIPDFTQSNWLARFFQPSDRERRSSIKDFVQELYLRELKSYKPSPQTIQAMQNQVRDFTMPSAPPPPVLPSAPDLAQEFQTWDNASLVNNNVQAETSSQLESGWVHFLGQTADEFLAFLERDHPAASSHH